MKKVLFASTALVLTAGVASAEITLSGNGGMGVVYDGTDTDIVSKFEAKVTGSGETDGGLTFGGSHDVLNGGSFDGDYTVFIATNGLTITGGNDVSNAASKGGIGDIGWDGIGVDDVAEKEVAFGTHEVNISYSFGDITADLSLDNDSDDWGVGIKGSFDAFSFSAGFDDSSNMALGLGYSAGAVAVAVHYEKEDSTGDEGLGLHMSYTTGDVTVSAAYADGTVAGEAYGIGVAYDLGGATLAAGFGEVAGTTKADLGISFDF